MRNLLLLFAFVLCRHLSAAQDDSLQAVTVTGYFGARDPLLVPAPVAGLSASQLQRFGPDGLVHSVNSLPGVRLEERSPSSYRFSIRGSALESPFGVRNVKVYYHGIPMTLSGGTTYLNQLGPYNIRSLSVLRGPGSSLYGAGIGGVLFLNEEATASPGLDATVYGGSYGSYGLSASVTEPIGKTNLTATGGYMRSDGYRAQSASERSTIAVDARVNAGKKHMLSAHLLLGKLNYQTPGGLTDSEQRANPQMARPSTKAAPGAAAQQAAIYQQMALLGISDDWQIGGSWALHTVVYTQQTGQTNPNIRNYSRVAESDYGLRSTISAKGVVGKLSLTYTGGIEAQAGLAQNQVFKNNAGTAGALMSEQGIRALSGFVFSNISLRYGRWMLEGGGSGNSASTRLSIGDSVSIPSYRLFTPRIALAYFPLEKLQCFVSVEQGYNPPTTDQLAPTGSENNLGLQPSVAWNRQAGIKYDDRQRLRATLCVFDMTVHDEIVLRRDSFGGDHYANAGIVAQRGLEASGEYLAVRSGHIHLNIAASATAYSFQYKTFIQSGADYSGNRLPGAAPLTLFLRPELRYRRATFAVSGFYSSEISLDDANQHVAPAYFLLGCRATYAFGRKRALQLEAGANNLLDERYSLGNDINAAGLRFYNPAPGINFFAALRLHLSSRA